MKLLTISLIFVTVACGKIDQTIGKGQTSVGELRPLNGVQLLNADEVGRINLICQAMARKASVLSTSIPPTNYTFNVKKTDCDKVAAPAVDLVTTIQPSSSNFFFVSAPNTATFPFPNVETHTNGVLAGVCQSISSLAGANLPLAKGSGEFLYLSTFDTDDCLPAFNELCIKIETASQETNAFRVHTSEWLKVVTEPTDQKYGFYTARKVTTRGFCAENKFSTTQATLK